ncbi:MAG: response regulator transcription factor [Chloroflexota bacterium]
MLADVDQVSQGGKILVVDDDAVLRRMVRYILLGEGYSVAAAGGGEQALEMLYREHVDLIVLDVGMPGMDGYQLCRTVREKRFVMPVLFLSAHLQIDDTIAGFDAGGDDYLVKPFAPRELTARVHAILQRQARAVVPPAEDALSVSGYTLELAELSVRLPSGQAVQLTPTEQRVLRYLMVNAGQIITRDQLFRSAWPEGHDGDSNEIQVYIGRLRRKLEIDADNPCIETVRGLGYRFMKTSPRQARSAAV